MASITNPKDYKYGNYASQPVPTPTTPNYNSDTLVNNPQGVTKMNDYIRANSNNADWKPVYLDDYAKQKGWNVNYSGGGYSDKPYIQKVNITNPATGQSYTLDNGTAGFSQGFGGLYNGKTIMRDTNFLTNYLGTGTPQPSTPVQGGQPTITNPKDYQYGNYAPGAQQQPTAQPQPQVQPMQIRQLAQQQGWNVVDDGQNRQFTVVNPQTGQQLTLPYDTKEYGMGGLVNGFNTVNDPSQLMNMLGGQQQQGNPQQQSQEQGQPMQSDFNNSVMNQQNQYGQINNDYNAAIMQLLNNKPQYDNSDIRNQYLNTMQDYANQQFNFDPNTNEDLARAQQQSMYANENEMNRRGILSSTVTTDRNQKIAQDLIPVFREQARKEFDSNLARKLQYANSLKDVDDMDYRTYSAQLDSMMSDVNTLQSMKADDLKVVQSNLDNIYKLDNRDREKQAEDYKRAIDRTEYSGAVSNKDAVILGVPPGTAAPSITKLQREMEMNLKQREAEQKQDYVVKAQILEDQQKIIGAKAKVMNTIKDTLKSLPPSQALQQLKASANDLIDKGVDVEDLNAYAKELETAAAAEIKSKLISTLSWREPQDALNVLISSYDDLTRAGLPAADYNSMVATLQKDIKEGKETAFEQEMKIKAQRETERTHRVNEGISYANSQETKNNNAQNREIAASKQDDADITNQVKNMNETIKTLYSTKQSTKNEDGTTNDRSVISAQDKRDIKQFITDKGQSLLNAGVDAWKVQAIMNQAYSDWNITDVKMK